MQQIIDISIFAIALSVILTLLGLLYKVKRSKDKIGLQLLQIYVDNTVLSERVATLAAEKDANSLKDDDGFIAFLSNSREWAFSYIEEVQEAIQKFKDLAGPSINKLSDSQDADVKLITEAYNNLVEILPDEDKKGN
jgi:anaerobic C4-dicarboxylate transporter